MAQYDAYAKFYDATQGSGVAEAYRDLLVRYHPNAENVLEIACGTGAVLRELATQYEVTGLDISRAMLRIARKKLPKTQFYQQDMTSFRIGHTFNAVICPYDAINHLLRFGDWVKTFKAVRRHLDAGAVFIFDMNTQFRLTQLIAQRPSAHKFEGGTLVVNVTDEGRGVSNWGLKVYEREKGSRFRLHRDSIKEISFPVSRIRESLEHEFRYVRALDARGWSRPKKSSRRLYFVCRR